MTRSSGRRLTGRCPVLCGSALGFAVSLNACTVQIVKRRRWRRSSGSRALVAAGRAALGGSWATSRQQWVLSIKAAGELSWQEILRARWDLYAAFMKAGTHGWHVRGA